MKQTSWVKCVQLFLSEQVMSGHIEMLYLGCRAQPHCNSGDLLNINKCMLLTGPRAVRLTERLLPPRGQNDNYSIKHADATFSQQTLSDWCT